MTKQEVRSLLPKVGDVRMEKPTLSDKSLSTGGQPEECTVIEVHPAHLWYRVKFKKTGFIECYKVPQTARLAWEDD